MKEFHRRKNGILFMGDFLVFALALIVTLTVRYRELPEADILSQHLVPFVLLFILWCVVFLIVGLYDQSIVFSRKYLPSLVLRTQIINTLLGVALFFSLPFGIAPKTNLVIYLAISTILIISWRLFLYPKIMPAKSLLVLLIGVGPELNSIRNIFRDSPYFKQVDIEYIDTSVYQDSKAIAANLQEYIESHPVDLVIADMNDLVTQSLAPVLFNSTFFHQNIQFFTVSDFYEKLLNRLPPSVIKESWMLEHMPTQAPHYAYDFMKRTIDILGAIVLLIPCLVIFPVVALAIYLSDKGALFYKTERIGQYGQPIQILKFRTMTGMDVGNEAIASKHSVTKVGAILRKTRIDELPQLFNVLKGELSFIGPRPEMPALASIYEAEIPYYGMRHLIKPGLSGWAQINNFDVPRQGTDVPRTIDKLSYDLYYLRHRSFILDMEIALKTIDAVLSRSGT